MLALAFVLALAGEGGYGYRHAALAAFTVTQARPVQLQEGCAPAGARGCKQGRFLERWLEVGSDCGGHSICGAGHPVSPPTPRAGACSLARQQLCRAFGPLTNRSALCEMKTCGGAQVSGCRSPLLLLPPGCLPAGAQAQEEDVVAAMIGEPDPLTDSLVAAQARFGRSIYSCLGAQLPPPQQKCSPCLGSVCLPALPAAARRSQASSAVWRTASKRTCALWPPFLACRADGMQAHGSAHQGAAAPCAALLLFGALV